MRITAPFVVTVLALAGPAQANVVEVTVTGNVVFNAIGEPPLSGVSSGEEATLTFLVDSDIFTDGVALNTRGYEIDQSSFSLVFESGVSLGLLAPFPPGDTPYFTLADGIPVADRFWVSTSVNSPGGVPLEQEPFNANVDLGYVGETLGSLDILDALGTYDFTGLTSFSFDLWAIFPDNVGLAMDFAHMTITAAGGCQINADCAAGEYCAKAVGDCDGVGACEPVPDSCIDIFDPVCGCDGMTYTNACFAAAAGVNVAFAGECPVGGEVPTVSEWGLIVMTLLLLTAGTIVFGRRSALRTG